MAKLGSAVLLGVALLGLGAPALSAQSFYRTGVVESAGGFGAAVVVNGPEVIVGEPANVMRPGLVYIYRRGVDGVWSESASLGAAGGSAGDGFGASLATEGDLLLVGSPAGVHSFVRGANGWSEEALLPTPPALDEESGFGATLVLRDGLALVGAPGAAAGAGAVHLFRREGCLDAGGHLGGRGCRGG